MTGAPIGYAALAALAQQLQRPLHSLMALSHGADPFLCGTPAHVAHAEWFASLWQEHMPRGGHLRRLHYRLVSQAAPVALVSGDPYQNTLNCWSTLKLAGKWARHLGLVDAGDVDDRRSPSPHLYLSDTQYPATLALNDFAFWASCYLTEPTLPKPPRLILSPPKVEQRYHVEVWVEKSDVEDLVLPIARTYHFNYCPFLGQPGLKPCRELVTRAEHSGRPVRILYLSDFDPQGQSMPVAVARKIEFILAERELDLDIELRSLALTKEQCVQLLLPRIPIKDGDRGKASFEERHGEGATELDALEALHPGLLQQLILDEVARYYDPTLNDRIDEACQALEIQLGEVNEAVVLRHEDELAELRAALKAITGQLVEVRKKLDPIREQAEAWCARAEPIYEAIAAELEAGAPDLSEVEWPEPAEGDEHPDPLFDSCRAYLGQIAVYKRFQQKPTEKRKRRANGALAEEATP